MVPQLLSDGISMRQPRIEPDLELRNWIFDPTREVLTRLDETEYR